MEKHYNILEAIDANAYTENESSNGDELPHFTSEEMLSTILSAFCDQPYLFDLLTENLPYINKELWIDAAILAATGDEVGLLQLISSQYDCRVTEE